MQTAAHVYEAFEYDLSLTAEQLQIRDTARRFAAEVLRPAGIAIDRMTPEAVIAPGSPLYRVLAQAAELGIPSVLTDNDSENAPMLYINETLGYDARKGFISFVKRVKSN